MRIAAAILVALIGSSLVAAKPPSAQPSSDPDPLSERMIPLKPLLGRWMGTGWMVTPTGSRQTFGSKEAVTARLSGAALLVEGQHRTMTDGRMVHDAMAMIVWDSGRNAYRMRSQLANGMGVTFP